MILLRESHLSKLHQEIESSDAITNTNALSRSFYLLKLFNNKYFSKSWEPFQTPISQSSDPLFLRCTVYKLGINDMGPFESNILVTLSIPVSRAISLILSRDGKFWYGTSRWMIQPLQKVENTDKGSSPDRTGLWITDRVVAWYSVVLNEKLNSLLW